MQMGTCPVCNGTGRRSAHGVSYKTVFAGYDPVTDTLKCDNCGGQTMSALPTGQVPLRKDGTPCVHEYTGRSAGRCYTIYTCIHCSYTYDIDSSD